MPILKTPRQAQQTSYPDVQEVYNVWKMLDDRYAMINHLQSQKKFVHDFDLKVIIDEQIDRMKYDVTKLEAKAETFNIKGPRPYSHEVNVKGNSEVLKDKNFAWVLYEFLTMEMNFSIRTLRDSYVDDSLRSLFIDLLKENVKNLFDYVDYLKLKGWIDIPPLYPYVPSDVNERITCNEVFFLWDHLIFRYQNIYTTRIFSSFVYDSDLKLIFDAGIKVLQKQANRLEDLLQKYGIAVPEPFSNVIPSVEDTQIFEDQFMFTTIFTQMRDASTIHAQAFIGSILNKEVRKVFYDFLFDEVEMTDKFIRYGKIKGWLPLVPRYKMG